MAKNPTFYYVMPRYTPGSPGMFLDDKTPLRIAEEEKNFITHALEGAWGEQRRMEAEALGLVGIVEARTEVAAGLNVKDLITGDEFFRPLVVHAVHPHIKTEVSTLCDMRPVTKLKKKEGMTNLHNRVNCYKCKEK